MVSSRTFLVQRRRKSGADHSVALAYTAQLGNLGLRAGTGSGL